MLREAEIARSYAAESRTKYLAADTEGLHLRDGLWRHVLQFLESGTRLGQSFRNANPQIPWALIHELRQELVHNYPEVAPDRVRAFALEELPRASRQLRRGRFPGESDSQSAPRRHR